MKKIIMLLIFFTSRITTLFADPLLVAVLMIKNEAAVIRQTLEPLVRDGITQFLIYDTGSNAHIIQEEFIDFSTSRNRALDYAEEKFPRAEFMIMPDAEWYLENGTELIRFCQTEYHKYPKITPQTPQAYLIPIKNNQFSYAVPILIRSKTNARFKGMVHETVHTPFIEQAPDTFFFKRELLINEKGWEKSKKRYVRDRDLLLKELEQNPRNGRTLFYLAQTYACMGDYENACAYYRLRTEVDQYDEEYYLAFYRLGALTEKLHTTQPEKYTWPHALAYYMQAYTVRPCRIEPLVMIAYRYLKRKEYPTCMLFIKQAASQPYPDYDTLIVETPYYTYDRYALLAECALQNREYTIAEWALKRLLHEQPHNEHFHTLLAFCETALAKQA